MSNPLNPRIPMPRGKKRKPSISRVARKPAHRAAPTETTTKLPADDVISALVRIAAALEESNRMKHPATAPVKVVVTKKVPAVESPAGGEALVEKRGRGRPPKHPCPTCGAPSKEVENGSGLFRCNDNHVWRPGESPAAAAEPAKPAAPAPAAPAAEPSPATGAAAEGGASPAPAAAPTLDAIRGVAISYATKHGKEGLAKLLANYGADRLSTVPEEQRAALLAALQAG